MESCSLTRDQTWASSIGSTVLATGPPGKSPSVHFMKSCFELSHKWTNVMNDHVDVSESFCLPSIVATIAEIILFIKIVQGHIWTNGESRFAFGHKRGRFELHSSWYWFVDARALDRSLWKFPWHFPCGFKMATESWKMTLTPCSKPVYRVSFPVLQLLIKKDKTFQRP